MKQYNEILHEQLWKGTLEEVDATSQESGIQHLLHQAVQTEQDHQTNLAIAIRSSSSNFRIEDTAVILDGEKAFQQASFLTIHEDEDDKGYTRCLWLRNYKWLPTSHSIQNCDAQE
ncbi:hypothetical protein RB195_001293 [Necator americanus]|uniref:Uncharacterized protein n=1 Tax=Necator americanus TaxID=51031 RepID=A0ABR1DDM9_NECAM